MDAPRITVLIPTRERAEVLAKSLATVVQQNYERLNIVVSDNASSEATREVVQDQRDSRISYVRAPTRLNMSAHWEFALSHVRPGFVTIIGDDDGLLPNSINRVSEILADTGVDALRSQVCQYSWPALSSRGLGRLCVPLQSGVEIRESRAWLDRLLAGRVTYPELPMLYNGGFVKTEILDEIRRRSGAVYRASAPDVYSAIAIASVIPRYAFSYEPLAVNGASGHSTGTSQFVGDSSTGISPAALFAAEGNIPFHPELPQRSDGSYPKSLRVIVYESFLQSRLLRAETAESIHAFQLELVLAEAQPVAESVMTWGREFARQHSLNFARAETAAQRRWLRSTLSRFAKRAKIAVNTHVSEAGPGLRDVYEASILAGEIRNRRLRRADNVIPAVQRLFR